MTPFKSLKKAVAIAGGQAALAKKCRVTQQAVSFWLRKSKRCPAESALAIESATGVSRHDLRPDLYPREDREAAA